MIFNTFCNSLFALRDLFFSVSNLFFCRSGKFTKHKFNYEHRKCDYSKDDCGKRIFHTFCLEIEVRFVCKEIETNHSSKCNKREDSEILHTLALCAFKVVFRRCRSVFNKYYQREHCNELQYNGNKRHRIVGNHTNVVIDHFLCSKQFSGKLKGICLNKANHQTNHCTKLQQVTSKRRSRTNRISLFAERSRYVTVFIFHFFYAEKTNFASSNTKNQMKNKRYTKRKHDVGNASNKRNIYKIFQRHLITKAGNKEVEDDEACNRVRENIPKLLHSRNVVVKRFQCFFIDLVVEKGRKLADCLNYVHCNEHKHQSIENPHNLI